MNKLVLVLRILLGALLIVFGSNKFINFLQIIDSTRDTDNIASFIHNPNVRDFVGIKMKIGVFI